MLIRRRLPFQCFSTGSPSNCFLSSKKFPNLKSLSSDTDFNVNMIVACCENYVIGKDGQLPWIIPEDWKYFKTLTTGGTLILGRRCYEERGCAFPNRDTIVVSKTLKTLPDAQVARSVEEALSMAQVKLRTKKIEQVNDSLKTNNHDNTDLVDSDLGASSSIGLRGQILKKIDRNAIEKHQIWICGGSKVYLDGAKFCSKLYLTRIHSSEIVGDTHFPAAILTLFPHLISAKRGIDKKYKLTYFVYEKVKESS